MKKTTTIVRLIAGLLLAGVVPVEAQTQPPNKKIFVDVNFGVQPSARTFAVLSPDPQRPDVPPQSVYGESIIMRGTQGIDGSTLLDISGGYRVWQNVSVALALTSTFGGGGDAAVTAGIPHPVFYDTRVESSASATDLAHREQAAHVSAMWTSPVTDKMDASVFGGPSYIKVYQDVIRSVTVTPGTQSFTLASSVEETATTLGFHFGGDVTFLFSPHVGIGGMVRFVKAKVDLPSASESIDAAGFQYGGGVRVRF